MDELARVRDAVKPLNVLLVLDAMTGQEAVNVAAGVPGADRLRRRRPDEARRRRARRRGALGQGDHRQADQVRVGRREARPARGLPPRPDGVADPRDGRRPDADREGRGRGRGATSRGDGAPAARRRVHVRRLPVQSYRMMRRMGPLKGVLKMMPGGLGKQLDGVDIDDQQIARVEAIDPLDDPARASGAAPDQRPASPPDRRRQRHLDRRGEQAARRRASRCRR